MSAARRFRALSLGWWSLVVVAGCSTVPTLSTPRADAASEGDAGAPDAPTRDAVVEDAGPSTDDAADAADPYGQCGEAAYQALCACTALTDVAALGHCQQQVFARFPRCSRCFNLALSRGCCDETYQAIQACATTHACGDQACIDARCGAESAAFLRCQMTAQALPACQMALQACIADFPRLMMCP